MKNRANTIGTMDDKQEFLKALKIVKEVFNKNGIEYWLDYGTLIGAVRESKILDWDYDTDISFWWKDVEKVHRLKNEFSDYGYNLRGWYIYKLYKDGQNVVDIMPAHIEKNYVVKTSVPLYWAMKYVRLDRIFDWLDLSWLLNLSDRLGLVRDTFVLAREESLGNFAYVPFYDDIFPIPEFVEDYLEFRYGDWRTPVVYRGLSECWVGERLYNIKND